MKTKNAFYLHRERYHYDFKKCKRFDGWVQFDTRQDAAYFGIWVHPEKRQIITWCEGDEITETCETETEYHEKLKSMAACYGDPPPAFRAISLDGTVTHYFDKRPE